MRHLPAIGISLALAMGSAQAQQAKDVKVVKGKAAAVVNLISLRPDCSQGTVGIPVIRDQPKHGAMSMAVTTIDTAAQGNCPARKSLAITLVYAPAADFSGADQVTIDVVEGNKTTSLSYRLLVAAPGETL